jgi:small basic protein (TIGR04137 family)
MTMDRTLKTRGGLFGTRSVLSRAERITKLIEQGNFDPEKDCPMGLPKVRVRHSKAGTKTKKAAEAAPAEGAVPAEGADAAPAAAAAAAPDAKAAKEPKAKEPKGKTKEKD